MIASRRLASSVLVLLLAAPNAFAQGGPPMLTDDPGTPGPGAMEINLAVTHREESASRESELPAIDVNYGVGERIQLNVEGAWNWTDSSATQPHSRLGDYSFGVKYRFVDNDAGWRLSTYPRVGFERDYGGRATNMLLPVEFQREYGDWGLDFEVGHEFRAHGRDAWIAGAALGRKTSSSFEWAAELHASGEGSSDTSDLVANAGARVTRWKSGVLMLSVGRELHVADDARPAWFAYAGWQFLIANNRLQSLH